jgi:serine/threonine-protein kinase
MDSGQIVAGKYRLNQVLGTGGMAEVWSATNTFTERQLAIKFMLPGVAKTKEAVNRFLQEAKVSARIDHPNIIEIFDVGQTEDGRLFLVMELLSGVSLDTAIRRQQPPMTLSEFAFVLVEVARALGAAHRAGVVHRDLKPTNIFLHRERDGRAVPKVLDFGVSKFLEEEGGKLNALTLAGTVLGSPLYMSPEQARGESRIDGRTDVFSFGAIMFEAICGYRAYDAPNFNALIVRIATAQPKNIDECAPHVSPALRAVVRRCLATEPRERYGSFDEIAEAIVAALPEVDEKPLAVQAPESGLIDDPDATNALPVVRASDRPPTSLLPPAYSYPPPPVSEVDASRLPPPPKAMTFATDTPFDAAPDARAAGRNGMVFGAALGAAVVTIGVVVALLVHRAATSGPRGVSSIDEGRDVATAAAPKASTAAPIAPPSAVASSSANALRVDTLPKESKVSIISFESSPYACTVTIDGVAKGTTPVQGISVPEGDHDIACRTAKGRLQTRKIRVTGGASDKIAFKF